VLGERGEGGKKEEEEEGFSPRIASKHRASACVD